MAVINASSFEGLDIQRVRVGSTIRRSDWIRIVEQQSAVYQIIGGTAVPGASLTATPHDHADDGGSRVLYPVDNHYLGARILRAGEGTPGYAPILYAPRYVSAGTSHVTVIVSGSSPSGALGAIVRLYQYDGSGAESLVSDQSDPPRDPHLDPESPPNSIRHFVAVLPTLVTSAGRWMGIEVSVWDGQHSPNTTGSGGGHLVDAERYVEAVSVIPSQGVPGLPSAFVAQAAQPGIVAQSPLNNNLIPVEAGFVSVDRGLSSLLTTRAARNDRIIGHLAQTHDHGGDVRQGVAFSRHIVSHSLGVMRSYPTSDAEQITFDQVLSDGWSGRIFAPCLTGTAGTTAQTVARSRFLLPRMPDTAAGTTGSVSRLQCAMLIYRRTAGEVSARLSSATGGGETTLRTESFTGSGRRLVLIDNVMATSEDGADQVLRVYARRTGSPVDGQSVGVYGYGLAVVP
jgi:hypothetical protein